MRGLLALLAMMALLTGVLLLSNRSLQHDLDKSKQQYTLLQAQLQQRETLITELSQQMRLREQDELALRQHLSAAQQVMQTREQQRQRSLRDDPQSQAWADAVLPADVSRLHERPAFHSASDYLRWLSGGQLMPDTAQPSRH